MKRMTLVGLCSTALTLGLIATMSMADEPDLSTSIVGFSQEFSPSLDGASVGSWILTINGEAYQTTSTSTPLLLAQPVGDLGENGGTTTHRYDLANGDSITSDDQQFLTPTPYPGWYLVSGIRQFTGGTGRFANASGQLAESGLAHVDEFSVEKVSSLEGSIVFARF